MSTLPTYTLAQVAAHNTEDDCWCVIDDGVYDLTKFAKLHPGGRGVITRYAGRDVTSDFHLLHGEHVLQKYQKRLQIGVLAGGKPARKVWADGQKDATKFGELIPYGDPTWYQGWNSLYYKDSHRRVRAAVRKFVDTEIMPFCGQWDEQKSMPKDIFRKAAQAGWLPGVIGAPWPSQFVSSALKLVGDIRAEEYDAFHELILIDEVARCGSGGVLWGLFEGLSIGLPPVMKWARPEVRDRVARETLAGEKVICLCISEPWAGSDVARIRTTAKKTADGKHYVVNGEKKWITNAVFADYFTVAVRTGVDGMGGISFLLLERGMPGLTTRQMNCQGVWPSGTTYITFENVLVPVENLLGEENSGFKYVMYNFNHERWGLVAQCNRFARVCVEECTRYAYKRKTFEQRLIDHPVIRQKLAEMVCRVESTHAWLESITHHINVLGPERAYKELGGQIGLLKVQATRTFDFCAREAMHIFGGAGYVRGSQGEKIERLYREVQAYVIGGGTEEILADMGIRQATLGYSKL